MATRPIDASPPPLDAGPGPGGKAQEPGPPLLGPRRLCVREMGGGQRGGVDALAVVTAGEVGEAGGAGGG